MTAKPLTNRQRTAPVESIEKWRQIERGEMADAGRFSCSCCMEFYANECDGCPISEETEEPYCIGSPYKYWEYIYEFDPSNTFDRYWIAVADTPEKKLAARAERKFLEGILKRRG